MNPLSHLPEEKQKEILEAVEIIKEEADPEKIFLFGSHATGKWVDSSYVEDGIKLSYISDYDFLVVLSDDKKDQEARIASHIENRCDDFEGIVSPAPHTISHINHGLSFGQFFFMRIINEGILLYDTGNAEFVKPKILTSEEQKKKAQDYFDLWFPRGQGFLKGAHFYLSIEDHRLCAFSLHQAAENFYATALLVFEGYKPTMHGLQKMRNYSKHLSQELYTLFLTPPEDAHQTHLFDLLKRGYVEARYKLDYNITHEECEELIDKLIKMEGIVGRICIDKIKNIR